MELYQSVLDRLTELAEAHPGRREYVRDASRCWQESDKFELVMARDCAFELGGSGKGSANCTIVTTGENMFSGGKIIVVGKELNEITEDTPYARIVILRVDPSLVNRAEDRSSSEKVFRILQKLDFVKYHVFAKGYMIRTSSENFREQVRVEKAAVRNGISFEAVGNCFLKHYLDVDGVQDASILFVTDPSVNYAELLNDARKVHEITLTFSKILEGMPTDCSMCSLKAICDEVEGMRELHFGKEGKSE